MEPNTGNAVVLGAGFAGSLAAYRLATAGWRVSLVEPRAAARARDHQDLTPGVAQSCHLHVLLQRGLGLLTAAYPGLAAQLDAWESPTLDWAADTVWSGPGRTAPRYASGVRTRSFSRASLDRWMLAQAVAQPTVTLLQDRATQVLLAGGRRPRVAGVRLAAGTPLPATLVVDCRGATATLTTDDATFNRRLANATDRLRRVAVGIHYRTVVLDGVSLAVQHYEQPLPPRRNFGAVLTPIEGRRAVLTTIHYPGSGQLDRPLAAGLRALRDPAFAAALDRAAGVSRPRSYRFDACLWRRYGRIRRWPDGLAVLGDAAYRLNPVFGQGMTVTALCVDALIRRLEAGGALRRFQRSVDRIVAVPWLLSSQTPGSWPARLIDWGLKRAFASPRLHRRFLRTQHMLAHPASFFVAALRP